MGFNETFWDFKCFLRDKMFFCWEEIDLYKESWPARNGTYDKTMSNVWV